MLHYLVTHVRDTRGKAASEATTKEAVVEMSQSATADGLPSDESPSTARAELAESEGSNRSTQPSVLTTLSAFLAVMPLLGFAGCTCLHRDKVDANVVSARQLSLRGMDAIQRGQWDDAENLFADALRKNPADERAHRHFAEVQWRRGQHQVAIRHQEESVRLSGGDPSLLVQLGEMYLKQGNAEAAFDCAEEAIDANNQLSGAWALRGDIHRRHEEPNEALECYHRALNYQSHYPHVQMALADLYRQADRPRRALATLESLASQYPPEDVPQEVEFQRGLALKALGRYQDAVETFALAAQRGEPNSDLLFHLSEAQFLAGNMASSRLALQAVLATTPNHSSGLKLKDKLERHSQSMTAAVNR